MILDDETAKLLKSHVRPEELGGPWLPDFKCLPATEEGLYKVYRSKDAEAQWVQEEDVHRYPWVAINSVWALEDGMPMKITPECFRGVNGKGISLVALDVTKAVTKKKVFKRQPTFQCHYKGCWHFIYRLRNFLPGLDTPKPATHYSLEAFSQSVEMLELTTGGMYIYDAPVLNPFSPEVWTKSVHRLDFTFADFRNADLTREELEFKRMEGKRRQREAGRSSAEKVKMKSVQRIIDAILIFKRNGRRLAKAHIAADADMNVKTVHRNWSHPDIQKLLK